MTAWTYGFGVLCLVVTSLCYARHIAAFYIPFEVSPAVQLVDRMPYLYMPGMYVPVYVYVCVCAGVYTCCKGLSG